MHSPGIPIRLWFGAIVFLLNPFPIVGHTTCDSAANILARGIGFEQSNGTRRRVRKHKPRPKPKGSPTPSAVATPTPDASSAVSSPSPSPSANPTLSPTARPSPCEKAEQQTSNQSVKISPQGVEVSGLPLWANISILIGGVALFIFSAWRVRKAVEEKSSGVAVAAVIVVIVAALIVGRVWDRWSTSSDSHAKIERAKEDSRGELPPLAPAPPSGLGGTAASGSQVNLSWADNSNSEDGFSLERKLGAEGLFTPLVALAPNATNYVDSGLSPEATVLYRIRAFNAVGNSAYSNEAPVTMLARVNLSPEGWSNPSSVFWYIILPVFFLILLVALPFIMLYYRTLLLRMRYRERERYDGIR